MTDRQAMVAVARLCEQAGAKLVLVGDHEQLESPEARGAMRLMARVAETFELGRVHRFVNDWERDASLRLRAGDVEVLDEYAAHGRIYGGTVEANEHRAVRLALADHLSGGRVFILAGTNERAARVAGLFRQGLVAHGLVEAGGVRLGDGNLAGVGDRIVCRTNDRTLTTCRGSFVTNRSVYEVVARDGGGVLTVAVVDPATGMADRGDWVALPAAYVAGQRGARVRRHHPCRPRRHPVRVTRPDLRARQHQQRLCGHDPRQVFQRGPCRLGSRSRPRQRAPGPRPSCCTSPHPGPGGQRGGRLGARSPRPGGREIQEPADPVPDLARPGRRTRQGPLAGQSQRRSGASASPPG